MISTFKSFSLGLPTRRQQKASTGQTRLHQNMVPDMHKVDPTLNGKVESLRNREKGTVVLNQSDLDYIIPQYNLQNLDKVTPKMLGKSGIQIVWDSNLNTYVLRK